MKYSKFLTVVLAMVLSISTLSGCGGKNEISQSQTNNANESSQSQKDSKKTIENKKMSVSGLDIEVMSCSFDNEVMGIDEEFSNYGFEKIDGKVYVNLALKITNKGEKDFKKDDITGYFEYNDARYDLQYELANVEPTKDNSKSILPGCVGIVHMLTRVEEAAMNDDIKVKYSISGKDFEEKVSPIDTKDALSKKTEVFVGDKIDANGLYGIEVIECTEKKYLQPTNTSKSEQYQALGDKKFVDLILKVKNNTNVDLKEIVGYIFVNDEGILASNRIEINDNTDIKDLDIETLKVGQEEYVHIYAAIDDSVNTEGLAMRFNLAGNCYYCRVK